MCLLVRRRPGQMTGTDSDRAHVPLIIQQATRQMTRTGTDRAHLLLSDTAGGPAGDSDWHSG